MIGFDWPTWIRPLNRKGAIFPTSQLFWHYLVDNPGCEAGTVAQLSPQARAQRGSCLVGALDIP